MVAFFKPLIVVSLDSLLRWYVAFVDKSPTFAHVVESMSLLSLFGGFVFPEVL